LISQINQSTRDSYQQLIDAAIILYFIPFLYMFLAAIKLSYRKDRASDPHAVLIPGGIPGVWIASGIAFAVTLLSIAFSVYPPGDASDRLKFQLRLLAWVIGALGVGLALYWRGARSKRLVSD
jgi:amino acid transporter